MGVEGRPHPGVWNIAAAFLLMSSPASVWAQKEPSHVERFASPKARYERAVEQATAGLQKNPKDPEALINRGTALVHLGELEAGVKDLREAAALEPNSADAASHLAYGLWLSGQLSEALAMAQKALALNANLASAQYYVGRLLVLTAGDTKEAIDHLQKAFLLNPQQTDIVLDLLQAYRMTGDEDQAEAQLRLLQTFLPPEDPTVLYAEGLVASDQRQAELAIDYFRRAVAASPEMAPSRRDLGIALAKAGRWQEAADALGPLAAQQPYSFSAAYFNALALQNSHHEEEAEREAQRAIALNPKSADAHTLLGIALSSRGAYSDSVSALESAVALDPRNFDAQFYLGRARYALRDILGARNAFRAALDLRPQDNEVRFFLATALEELGDRDGALAEYREMTQRDPQDARGYVGLGNSLAEHGQNDDAMAALNRARELDPQNFEATFAMGRLLAREGQWQPAIALLREATQRKPGSAEAHYQLGLALRRNGQGQEAEREFATVQRLNQQLRMPGMGRPIP